jgi:hypothetical protein
MVYVHAAPEPLHYEWRSLLIQLDKPLPRLWQWGAGVVVFGRRLTIFLRIILAPTKSWRTGLVLCVLSGVFSAGLNIAISFGTKMGDLAQANGTDSAFADNAAWSLGK